MAFPYRVLQGQTGIESVQDGHCRKHRWIVRPAGEDDVGTTLQCFDKGLDAHLGNDVRARQDVLTLRWSARGQRKEVAGVEGAQQCGLADIGGDGREPKAQVLLTGDLTDDLKVPGKMGCSPAAPGRANDNGDLQFPAGFEHQPQVALDSPAVGEGHASAQIIRAGVDRASVNGNGIRVALKASFE